MCNIFLLGMVLTSIEMVLYIFRVTYNIYKNYEYLVYGFGIIHIQIIVDFVAMGCLILEFIGLKKKHLGLSIFSIVFRIVQFGWAFYVIWPALLWMYTNGEFYPSPRAGIM